MKVTATLQAEGQAPVEQVWCRVGNELDVIMSVTQLLQHDKDDSPWSPRTRKITIELS